MSGDDETEHAPLVSTPPTPPDSSASGRASDSGWYRALPSGPSSVRYGDEALLGRGGMGEVFEVTDHTIGRRVAIKRIRPDRAGDGRERFVREAKIQGQLEHPSIVPVHDLGTDPEGLPFFTMRAVQGTTLRQILERLREGRPADVAAYSRARLLTVFVDVCQAVAFAHEHAVIHRDLKPANIMLGDFGEVYVLDWGVAKVETDTDVPTGESSPTIDTGDTGDTAAGAVMGTPGYLAPEQIRSGAIDRRTDVYALGAVLFEILYFEPLHRGRNSLALAAAATEGVDWDARLADVALDAPPELVRICQRATAVDPDDRYDSARDLLTEVEAYVEGTRDLNLRRQTADAAVARARQHLDEGARRDALQELGRAIALVPSHPDASELLATLFSRMPDEIPTEVEQELEQAEHRASQAQAKVAGVSYFSWLGIPAFLVWMGTRQWSIVIGLTVVALITAFIALAYSRWTRRSGRMVAALAISNAILIALTSRIFGPLFVTPALAAVYCMGFVLNPGVRRPALFVAGFIGTALLPWTAEQIGLLPPSYTLDGEHLTIAAHAVTFDPFATQAMLLTNTVLLTAFSAATVYRLRNSLTNARRAISLQAWQLRQLVPARAE